MADSRPTGFDLDDLARTYRCATPTYRPGFTRKDLYRQFAAWGLTRIAEIGVASGKNSADICAAIPHVKLLCVDPWTPYSDNGRGRPASDQELCLRDARRRLQGFDVTFMRSFSMSAVQLVPRDSLDAVFIDGNHKYDYVADDLARWSERVRPGGVVAGHDFYHFHGAGVIEAVCRFVAAQRIREWWILDARALVSKGSSVRRRYKEHSFYWFRP